MTFTNAISDSRWRKTPRAVIGSIALLLAGCIGTGIESGSQFQKYNETQLRDGIAGGGAPGWVTGQITESPGLRFFVGRGSGYNVLDERAAFDEAMDHARAQLAQYVGSRVATESCLGDLSAGTRFLIQRGGPGEGEAIDQTLRARAHAIAENIVGELYTEDQYWEQWQVDEDPDRYWQTPDFSTGNIANGAAGAAIGGLNTGTTTSATATIGAVLGLYAADHDDYQMRRYKCWVLASVPEATIEKYIEVSLTAMDVIGLEDELLSARRDADDAQNILNQHIFELTMLRERVHYGRRFRLINDEENLEYRAPFKYTYPEWREAEILPRRVPVEHVHDGFCAYASEGCLLNE